MSVCSLDDEVVFFFFLFCVVFCIVFCIVLCICPSVQFYVRTISLELSSVTVHIKETKYSVTAAGKGACERGPNEKKKKSTRRSDAGTVRERSGDRG